MTMSQENRCLILTPATDCQTPPVACRAANLTKSVSFSLSDSYTWYPPGLTPQQVENYFQQIPGFKVPRKKSAGDLYRKLQLAYQVPDQDIDLKHCLYIEPQFVPVFEQISRFRSDEGLDFASAHPPPDSEVVKSGA